MKKHHVHIKTCKSLDESIAEIFRSFRFTELDGRKVFVKPNMLRPAKPDDVVVTNPKLVTAVVSSLLDAGADVIVGDNPVPNGRLTEVQIAEYCGFIKAAKGRFRSIGRYSRKIRRQKNLLNEVYISREIADCDILVSLPKFKTHDLTTMSVAVKNQFGIIPGGLKPYIHSLFPKIKDFCRVLLEIYRIRPPDLIIVDCLDIVDARGKRFTPGKIIASNNGHAVDYVCAQIAGINPDRVPTLKLARENGSFEPDKIELAGELEALKGYAAPFRFPFRNAIVQSVAQILYKIWLSRIPVIDASLCSKCLSCENVCPKKAIKGQKIDYKECIKCYCCIEVCPNRAMKTKFKF